MPKGSQLVSFEENWKQFSRIRRLSLLWENEFVSSGGAETGDLSANRGWKRFVGRAEERGDPWLI